MDKKEYYDSFEIPSPGSLEKSSKYEKALEIALDIRKFEIELYWKRATYFWTFIAASFAGYALVYKMAGEGDSWLLHVFSSLGLLFSISWYLVNRGSKFWQNNWERHVDLLEDHVMGPLYKIIAKNPKSQNPLISAAPYSVSKINQILSVFISLFWFILMVKSLLPLSLNLDVDWFKLIVFIITASGVFSLCYWGKSLNKTTEIVLEKREMVVKPKPKPKNPLDRKKRHIFCEAKKCAPFYVK